MLKFWSGCIVSYGVHFEEIFDQCVIATNATDALSILGNEATQEEKRVLGAFHYVFRYFFFLKISFCPFLHLVRYYIYPNLFNQIYIYGLTLHAL